MNENGHLMETLSVDNWNCQLEQEQPWAIGDGCVSLKMLKSPHKEIYSFKLTMLWLSLSSSLSCPNISTNMHTTTVA